MGNGIPPVTLQLIRDRIDLVDVVSRYVTLSKAGQNYKGLCPFHSEKTPSFSVSSTRQMFYCFGCGTGGDAFAFLMKYEGMGFQEAVRELGRQAGVSVHQEGNRRRGAPALSSRERFEQIHGWAASWFQENLQSPQIGKLARDYVEQRGIGTHALETFGLGYVPPGWDGLVRSLRKHGATDEEMIQAGLVVHKSSQTADHLGVGRCYDRFRGRVMFPISDLRGSIIAFGGRVCEAGETPKYLNSPETPFFSKGRSLYGLDKARETATHLHRLLIVEGYFDVITLHQAGVTHAVAPLGTALTKDQVETIRRFATTIILLFDGDAAGKGAALRTLDLFVNTGLTVKVVSLPAGDDPDTFVRREGVEAFLTLEQQATGLIEFAVSTCLRSHPTHSVEDRVRSADDVLRILQKTRNPIEKEEYTLLVSEQLGIRQELLIKRYPTLLAPSQSRGLRPKRVARSTQVTGLHQNREERDLISLLLQGQFGPTHVQQLKSETFTVPQYRRIIEIGLRHIGTDGLVNVQHLQAETLNDQECGMVVAQLALEEQYFDDPKQYLQGCLAALERKHLQKDLQTLISKLRLAEREKRQDDIHRLVLQINVLRGQKAALTTSPDSIEEKGVFHGQHA